MKYFIGIDGGGSKTQFELCDETGNILSQHTAPGSDYKQSGEEAVCSILLQGIQAVLGEVSPDDIGGVCFGMPRFGESADDARVAQCIVQALSPLPLFIENDVVIAWAGALAFEPGVVILAGTGSMAVGRDAAGKVARSGGWLEFFSDEGSGYWLGRRTLELFSKQSDGRVPRGRLHALIRERFELPNDFALIDKAEPWLHVREKVASLQMLLEAAALEGDASAAKLYEEAAGELALMVKAVCDTLGFSSGVTVCHAGGLFKVGELILAPLRRALSGYRAMLQSPRLLPVDGAVLFAADHFSNNHMPQLKSGLLKQRGIQK